MRVVNVLDFGAVGDRLTDCTNAFRAAALVAGECGKIIIPPGRYLLSGTIQGLTNQVWQGAGRNSTILVRQSDYGDTFNFENALACSISGIFFRHGTQYTSGDSALDCLATGGSAHIRLKCAQGSQIFDCWLWRMPYGVAIDHGSLVKIHHCNMQSTWDHTSASLQEGIASVLIGGTGYTQIIAIDSCYFGGSGSNDRDVVYTSSDGTITASQKENIGSKNAIRVLQCEDLCVTNNYFGGNNASNMATSLVSGSVNLDWRITGNFFDAAISGACINMLVAADGAFVNGVTIANNVFNGEMQTRHAIAIDNRLGDAIVLTNFAITGNTFQAFYATPLLIYHARGGTINSNTITGYNAQGASVGGDFVFSAAVFFSKKSSHILCNGNVIGGAVNSALPSAYCYNSVVKGSSLPLPATIIDSNNLLIS